MAIERCCAMITVEKVGVLPGKWKTYRCRKQAVSTVTIRNDQDFSGMPSVVENWFAVPLCADCQAKGK